MTNTEKGILARAIKAGEDQINFLREQQSKENQEPNESQEEESSEE